MALVRAPLPNRRRRLIAAVVASLVAHVVAVPLLVRGSTGAPGPKRTKVAMVATPRSQVLRVPTMPGLQGSPGTSQATLSPHLPPAPKPALAPPAKPEPIDGQVVSIGQPKDERPPEAATKFLSEKDSRVDKQTRAKETSPFHKNALSRLQKEGADKGAPKPESEPPPLAPPKAHGEEGDKGGPRKLARQDAAPAQVPARQRTDSVRIPEGLGGTVRNRAARDGLPGLGRKLAMARPQQGESEGGQGGPGAPGLPGGPGALKSLNLSLRDMGRVLGPVAGGPMNDDLRGIEEGDETLLNSRGFKYAGFLNRVKETVARIWVHNVQDEAARRDPTGQLYSFKDRRTVVEFTLDREGELRDVKVQSSSGVDYLDRVAVDAFRKAERFPNPPPGLLHGDGTIRLPFAFTLLSTPGGFRIQMGPAYLPGSPAQRGF